MKNKSTVFFVLLMLIGLIAGIVRVNRWLQGQVNDIGEQPVKSSEIPKTLPPEVKKPQNLTGPVIRKTRLDPERTFEVSVFYRQGEEIARHKVTREGEIYDQEGKIPDGLIKFINESNETFGVEQYLNGVRNGPMRVKYKGGQLKEDVYYQGGDVITRKEFYMDGSIRMEEDYGDARESPDGTEKGVGKVYARDGVLKYEWHFTYSNPVGFRKSYNRKGELTDEIKYDINGQVIPAKSEVSVMGNPAGTVPVQGNP